MEYVEYLFNAKKLKKLDPDGYTYYERRLKGELGRRYERLYLALRRLANHIPDFCYTDYSGWRRLSDSINTPPLWIEAEDPAHHRHLTFEHRGVILRPLSQTATPILCRATCTVSGMIWRLICSPYIKVSFRSMRPGLKNAAEKVTQGMTRPLHKHSKKQAKSAKRRQKRNSEKGAQNHENQIISQGLVRSCLA